MLGNWFYLEYIDGSKSYHFVTSINTKEKVCPIYYNKNKEKCQITQCHPIPLTEELLLKKCKGFTNHTNQIFVYDSRFKFAWIPQYKYYYVTTLEASIYLTKIEFLHELQNFIFINCGKHLEIEL